MHYLVSVWRVNYEKKHFPNYVDNQTFGMGFLILNFIGYISYLSNYTLGGGAIFKIGYLINDNYNILLLNV